MGKYYNCKTLWKIIRYNVNLYNLNCSLNVQNFCLIQSDNNNYISFDISIFFTSVSSKLLSIQLVSSILVSRIIKWDILNALFKISYTKY